MSNSTEKFIQKWEKNLVMGRTKYALINGAIWGLFVGIVSSIFHFYSSRDDIEFSIQELLIKIVIFIVAGIIMYYFFMWKIYNNQYHKIKNNS